MIFKLIEDRWQRHFFSWLDKRSPLGNSCQLNRKNLLVFPTSVGFIFLFLTLLVWLLGTNYQNNVILALAYTQISLFIVVILNTYTNLSGLHVKIASIQPCFVGEYLQVTLELTNAQRSACERVVLSWVGQKKSYIDLPKDSTVSVTVVYATTKRGYLKPGRLLIESHFPMGLVRCWSWMNADVTALIYPTPIQNDKHPNLHGVQQDGSGDQASSGDDFWGLRQYQPGDPLRHIAWKHYAKGKGLYSKEYADTTSHDTWLMWKNFYQGDTEATLSQLCYWALHLYDQNAPFGLDIPGVRIALGTGVEHKEKVLHALALFGGNRQGVGSQDSRVI